MATTQDIIKIASKEIGYKEGKNNSNKYGEAYGWNNVSYCVQFIWWVFKQANASDLFYDGNKVASCTKVYEWAKKNGLIVEVPRAGDLVIFDWNKDKVTDHIGIIEATSGSILYTIEGNTGNGNPSDGDGVYRRQRSTTSKFCYIRPNYSNAVNSKYNEITINLPTLAKGETSYMVSTLQGILNAKGYKLSIDGDFGKLTAQAVKDYQKKNKLTVDGIVGKNTWFKLLS